MATKQPKRPERRSSGPTQSEPARKRKQLLLRVLPIVAHSIAERSKELGIDKSAYVTGLVVADVAATRGSSAETDGGGADGE